MPEGDSIHRHAALLQRRLVGKSVAAVHARGLSYPALAGARVTAVEPAGKHLFVVLGDRAQIHVHLGMTGRLRLVPRAALSSAAAARASLVVAAEDVAAVWWRARTVEVLRAAFAHAHPARQTLGPDLLGPTFDVAAATARARARPPDTTLGELLLDQRVAAGIGNIFKCEALFLERRDPWAQVSAIEDAALGRLYQRARVLMRASLARGARGQRLVYRRRGHPCPACGTPVAAAPQGQPPRTTYYCPRCQR